MVWLMTSAAVDATVVATEAAADVANDVIVDVSVASINGSSSLVRLTISTLAQCYKTFLSVIYEFCNKLECLPLAILFNLV